MNRAADVDSSHRDRCRRLYGLLIAGMREAARRHGYALGVHGSLAYDIDLIACPWRKGCCSARDVAEAIRKVAEAINGTALLSDRDGAANPDYFDNGQPGAKPHGRLCWSFHLGGGPYIDLSVMPRMEEA
jgi:hypothetical protein